MLTRTDTEDALRDSSVVFSMPRDVVVITGGDADWFLEGQLSQAVKNMAVGTGKWSLLLEPQGKVAGWLRVTRPDSETFWIDTEPGTGDAAVERLERFTLRTKVSFKLVQAMCYAVRFHPESRPAKQSHVDGGDASPNEVIVPVDWSSEDPDGSGVIGYDLVGIDVARPDGVLGDPMVLEALRIRDGVPSLGREFQRATIPAETGVVQIAADFTKGCYTGQELVARVNSRGSNTPRKVHRVTFAGVDLASELQPTGDRDIVGSGPAGIEHERTLFAGSDEVGVITSAALFGQDTVALASIKRGVTVPCKVQIDVGDTVAEGLLHEPKTFGQQDS